MTIKQFITSYFESSLYNCKTIEEFQQILFDKFYDIELVKKVILFDKIRLNEVLTGNDWKKLANPNYFSYFLCSTSLLSHTFNVTTLYDILRLEQKAITLNIKGLCEYYFTDDDYTIYMVVLYSINNQITIKEAWQKYFELYQPKISVLLQKMNEYKSSQLKSQVKSNNLDWTCDNENILNIVKDNKFIAPQLIDVDLATILSVPNNYEKNYVIESNASRWQGIGGELNMPNNLLFSNNNRLYEQWIFSMPCDYLRIGLRAFYLDNKLVAIAYQTSRKGSGTFYWVSYESKEAVRYYLYDTWLTERQKEIHLLEDRLNYLKNKEEYGENWNPTLYINFNSKYFSPFVFDLENDLDFSIFK